MATETLKEFRKLPADKLQELEQNLRTELFKLRTGGATEKVKDSSKAGKIKKDIARILTIQREHELKNKTTKA
jgi:large subunit ribosomal protein L29